MTCELTILLPYFNESGWLGKTIDSLANQSDARFRLMLIDNASTDGSDLEARRHGAALGDRVEHMAVAEPGKTQALAAAQRRVATAYIAVCDADTFYPPEYVGNILALFAEDPRISAVMATDLYASAESASSQRRIHHILRKARRRPGHCHAGGYAQAFRSSAFFAAGGFNPSRWPFLMEDHEIVHRVLRFGPARYAPHHYCFPSERRKNRVNVHWNRFERLVYHLTPQSVHDWYFYSFLARRLVARHAVARALRNRDWETRSATNQPAT